MAVNDFKAFAIDPGANVMTQADYVALAALVSGFSAGIAPSAQLNKVWRQGSIGIEVMGAFINAQTGLDALDDGNIATLLTNFTNAVKIASGVKADRVVTVSTALTILISDYAIGLKRIVAPAATAASLPAAADGQEFAIEDLAKNFAAFPVTVTPPVGDDIAGDPTFICNVNKGVYKFRRYIVGGIGSWSVSKS
jgi:hypothetical protein